MMNATRSRVCTLTIIFVIIFISGQILTAHAGWAPSMGLSEVATLRETGKADLINGVRVDQLWVEQYGVIYANTYAMSYLRGQSRYATLNMTVITSLQDKLANAVPHERTTLGDFLLQNLMQVLTLLVVFFLSVIAIMGYTLRQRSRSNQKIYDLLYLDDLTGIWNYNKFRAEVPKLLTDRDSQVYALVSTDISRFQAFNDAYGYAQGDRLLQSLARAIGDQIDSDERYARVSGDNFLMILKYGNVESFELRLAQILRGLSAFRVGERELYRVSLISGIYVIPAKDTTDLSAMLDYANTARKLAGGAHGTRLAYYDDGIREENERNRDLEATMETALATGQFVPFLQPQFDLQTGLITGMEALVRWFHPRRGIVTPDLFVPLFEQNGFIIEVDMFIFEAGCRIQRERLDQGRPCVPLSCNFSRLHMRRENFAIQLAEIAGRYGVPHSLLQIEITESAAEESQARLVSLLEEVRSLGFSIAMDDFGSGYSSLNLLNAFPVDVLKLDKDFLHKSFVGRRDRIIIAGFVSIAQQLNLKVVCEGVETVEQAEFLRSIGCNTAQGFLYARPMPLSEAEIFFDENLRNYGCLNQSVCQVAPLLYSQ